MRQRCGPHGSALQCGPCARRIDPKAPRHAAAAQRPHNQQPMEGVPRVLRRVLHSPRATAHSARHPRAGHAAADSRSARTYLADRRLVGAHRPRRADDLRDLRGAFARVGQRAEPVHVLQRRLRILQSPALAGDKPGIGRWQVRQERPNSLRRRQPRSASLGRTLTVGRCTLSAARCPLHVFRCMLSVACCPLHVVRCTLTAACCLGWKFTFALNCASHIFVTQQPNVCVILRHSLAHASEHEVQPFEIALS